MPMRWRTWWRVLAVGCRGVLGGVLLTGLLAGLAACGNTSFPRIIGKNCGNVDQNGLGTSDPDEAEQCLWNAYQQCQTASLVYNMMGVDVGSTAMLTVQKGQSACAVSVTTQGTGPDNLNHDITTYTCNGLDQRVTGLVATGCGSAGDILFTARPHQEVGHVCGYIHGDTAETDVTSAESCFWHAYTNCASLASLLYRALSYPYAQVHTLVVQPTQDGCALTDALETGVHAPLGPNDPVTIYTCASLAQPAAGGLLARACGEEGDVVIPAA